MVCETSSRISESVCESLGFQLTASVAYLSLPLFFSLRSIIYLIALLSFTFHIYNDWMFQGENLFAELPKISDNFHRLSLWERPIPSDLY